MATVLLNIIDRRYTSGQSSLSVMEPRSLSIFLVVQNSVTTVRVIIIIHTFSTLNKTFSFILFSNFTADTPSVSIDRIHDTTMAELEVPESTFEDGAAVAFIHLLRKRSTRERGSLVCECCYGPCTPRIIARYC